MTDLIEFLMARLDEREEDDAWRTADFKAKYRIIQELESAEISLRNTEPGTAVHELMTGAVNIYRRVVRLLASAFAEHPDYRPEWAHKV
ncbi:DUF6221 family protein [Streptomyces sp. NBC_01476]|uniref:DUF6221 family protein n=1 Tax=Streptomyces sp. NBC_01476 TaxID=2903881 RepID=UPI002E330D74|nr:DUF6221 family protein [Streptomyces sp. NBC_01476]